MSIRQGERHVSPTVDEDMNMKAKVFEQDGLRNPNCFERNDWELVEKNAVDIKKFSHLHFIQSASLSPPLCIAKRLGLQLSILD